MMGRTVSLTTISPISNVTSAVAAVTSNTNRRTEVVVVEHIIVINLKVFFET